MWWNQMILKAKTLANLASGNRFTKIYNLPKFCLQNILIKTLHRVRYEAKKRQYMHVLPSSHDYLLS